MARSVRQTLCQERWGARTSYRAGFFQGRVAGTVMEVPIEMGRGVWRREVGGGQSRGDWSADRERATGPWQLVELGYEDGRDE